MTPHTPTLFIVGAVICGLAAGVQMLVTAWAQIRALKFWAGSNLAFSLGCLLLAARSSLPEPLVSILGNGLLALGAALLSFGISVFDGKRPHLGALLAGPALVVAGLAASFALGDHLWQRALLVSAVVGYYFVRAALQLLYPRHRRAMGVRIACAAVLLVFSAVYAGRGVLLPLGLLSTGDAATGVSGGVVRILALALVAVWNSTSLILALERMASHDGLTGLLNRAAMIAAGESQIAEVAGGKGPLSVLLIDLDRFKAVNDRFGHHLGDCVLQAFASVMTGTLRSGDAAGRVGGEEFCVTLADTDAAQAMEIAERLRAACARELRRVEDRSVDLTISVGVVTHRRGRVRFLDLMKAADAALYEAKARGRNQVTMARADGAQ